jgi:crotonobetainyl-CoA:carnitine CoA-transferase CaiB-like acyl-CoA transferase
MPLLKGVTVLELGTVAMAPYAGQWLADLGADVIKIEAPEGDSTRNTGPSIEPQMATMFLALNRNKRSIVLDLKTEAGRTALLHLVDGADVIFHNTRPMKMAKLGLDAASVLKRNPRIVFASLHGYGENGPYAGRPAYDDTIQSASGLADLMGRQLGEPRYVPTIIADKTTGLMSAIAILAGLSRRDRTGVGVSLEIPMFESMVAFTAVEHLYGATFVPPLTATAYPRLMAEYRRPYATSDGYLSIMPNTDGHWRAFFEVSGQPALASDPRFTTQDARTRHIAELYGIVAKAVAQKTKAEWETICDTYEIPYSAVRSIDELLEDKHLKATGFFSDLVDPGIGKVRFPGVPVTVDGERPDVRFPPRLGEHTREVLEQAGVPADVIAEVEKRRS